MVASEGYSAKVVLTLLVRGARLALAQVGPSGLIVRDPCEPRPPCNARLLIQVDASKRIRRVFLPHGIPGPDQPVEYF